MSNSTSLRPVFRTGSVSQDPSAVFRTGSVSQDGAVFRPGSVSQDGAVFRTGSVSQDASAVSRTDTSTSRDLREFRRDSTSRDFGNFGQYERGVSRTATNATDATGGESVRTLDQLSTAKASVAMLDKLWTQIDVLDDVKAMARDVRESGSFFSDDFNDALAQVKVLQRRLLDVMVQHHDMSERAREERRKVALVEQASDLGDHELTKQRMHSFFFGLGSDDGAQARDFDELNEYVEEVRDRMGDVGERMQRFDDAAKLLW